ncbi:hypothetical protein AAMO2058_000857000 [Amorphochlora amoebiformis]
MEPLLAQILNESDDDDGADLGPTGTVDLKQILEETDSDNDGIPPQRSSEENSTQIPVPAGGGLGVSDRASNEAGKIEGKGDADKSEATEGEGASSSPIKIDLAVKESGTQGGEKGDEKGLQPSFRPGRPRTASAIDLERLIVESRKLLQKESLDDINPSELSLEKLINSDSDDDDDPSVTKATSDDGMGSEQMYRKMLEEILRDSDDSDEEENKQRALVEKVTEAAEARDFETIEEPSPSIEELMKRFDSIDAGSPTPPPALNDGEMSHSEPKTKINLSGKTMPGFGRPADMSPSVTRRARSGTGERQRAPPLGTIGEEEAGIVGSRVAVKVGGHKEGGQPELNEIEVLWREEISKTRTVGSSRLFTPLKDRREGSESTEATSKQEIMAVEGKPLIHSVLRKERNTAGIPTSCAVGAKNVVVGASYGFFLTFNPTHSPTGEALGQHGQAKMLGKVMCLDISPDGTTVAVGHAKGQVILWDLQKGSLIKSIDTFSSRVTLLKFSQTYDVTRMHKLLAASVRGEVAVLNVSKGMFFNWNAQKTHESKFDSIAAMEGLVSSKSSLYPIDSLGLVALSDSKNLIILATDGPRLGPVARHPHPAPLEGNSSAIAYTPKRPKPHLAVAVGDSIRILELSVGKGTVGIRRVSGYSLPSTLGGSVVALKWVGESLILGVGRRSMSVLNAQTGDPYQTVSLPMVNLILAKSPAPPYASAVSAGGDGVLLMGLDTAVQIRARGWEERIELETKRAGWIRGLALAIDFYAGTAKAPFGLPADTKTRKALVGKRCEEMLGEYLDLALGQFLKMPRQKPTYKDRLPKRRTSGGRSRGHTEEAPHFRVVGAVVVDFCLSLGRESLLFGKVFDIFLRAGGEDVLLDLLEPFILHSRLSYVPPKCFEMLAKHLTQTGRKDQLERCILRLDMSKMDNDHTVKICEQHAIWSGVLYAYTNKSPKNDFSSPILALHQGSKRARRAAAMGGGAAAAAKGPGDMLIFLYLWLVFQGKRYPEGEIEKNRIPLTQAQVVSAVFEKYPFTKDAPAEAAGETFPIAKTLARVNLPALLGVLDILFSHKDWLTFKGSKAARAARRACRAGKPPDPATAAAAARKATVGDTGYVPTPEEIVEALISFIPELVVDERLSGDNPQSEDVSARARYLVQYFAARHMASGAVAAEEKLLGVCLDQITRPPPNTDETPKAKDLRQKVILKLLEKAQADVYDPNTLLLKAEKYGLHQVRVFLLRERGDYDNLVQGYLSDPGPSRKEVFGLIRSVLVKEKEDIKGAQIAEKMRGAVLREISALVECDEFQAARLVIDFFADKPGTVISKLNNHSELQFQVLRQIMLHRRRSRRGTDLTPEDLKLAKNEPPETLGLSSTGDIMDTESLLEQSGLKLTDELHRIFIRLLCQHNPSAVYPHLTMHHDYDVDSILELCREKKINDATAYLLERTGDLEGAVKLTLVILDENVQSVQTTLKSLLERKNIKSAIVEIFKTKEYEQAIRTLKIASARCRETVENEEMWFLLLDRVVSYKPKGEDEFVQAMRHCVRGLIYATLKEMLGDVRLDQIIHRIFQKYPNHDLADFRDSIRDMLETTDHEVSVRISAIRLQQADLFRILTSHVLHLSRATKKFTVVPRGGYQKRNQAAPASNSGGKRDILRRQRLRRWAAMERRNAEVPMMKVERKSKSGRSRRELQSMLQLEPQGRLVEPRRKKIHGGMHALVRKEIDFGRV